MAGKSTGDLRTPLGRARGLGSAKDGTHHWWAQRLTAVALVPLTIWFVAALVAHAGADHASVAAWIGSPLTAVMLILLIAATFHHAQLGLQVVIEDYVHGEVGKVALIVLAKFAAMALGLAGVLAVIRLSVGG